MDSYMTPSFPDILDRDKKFSSAKVHFESENSPDSGHAESIWSSSVDKPYSISTSFLPSTDDDALTTYSDLNLQFNHRRFVVGDRVCLTGTRHQGTVIYVGPVHFSQKELVGVVLDKPYGKHNGICDGFRYFQCSPKKGIFSPVENLTLIESRHMHTNPRNFDLKNRKKSSGNEWDIISRPKLPFESPLRRTKSERLSRNPADSLMNHQSYNNKHSAKSINGYHMDVGDWGLDDYMKALSKDPKIIHHFSFLNDYLRDCPSPSIESTATYPRMNKSYFLRRHSFRESKQPKPIRPSRDSNGFEPPCPVHATSQRKSPRSPLVENGYGHKSPRESQLFQTRHSSLKKYLKGDDNARNEDLVGVDTVIACAEDRLMDLRTQVYEQYDMNTKLENELVGIKMRQNELRHNSKASLQKRKENETKDPSAEDELKDKLVQEFQRSRNLVTQYHDLHNQISDSASSVTQRPLDYGLTSHDLDQADSGFQEIQNWPTSNPQLQSNLQDLLKEKFEVCQGLHNQYELLLDRIARCRGQIAGQINVVHKELTEGEVGQIDSATLLTLVYAEQQKTLYRNRNAIGEWNKELCLMNADISHLRERPERKLRKLMDDLNGINIEVGDLRNHLQDLKIKTSAKRQELMETKRNIKEEDPLKLALIKTNLRIHQLMDYEFKVQDLNKQRCQILDTKKRELEMSMNKRDIVSEAWAIERQLKIAENDKLQEQLNLVIQSRTSSPDDLLDSETRLFRSNLSQSMRRTNHKSKPPQEQSVLTYELVSALCKEIRRLESRSVTLVDALDALNTKNYTPEKLSTIRSLVFPNKMSKLNISDSRNLTVRKLKKSRSGERNGDKGGLSNKTSSQIRHRPSKNRPGSQQDKCNSTSKRPVSACYTNELHNSTKTLNSLVVVPENLVSQPLTSPISPRRRPVSFYLRRAAGSISGDSIPEADEESDE